MNNSHVILIDGDFSIDDELRLFVTNDKIGLSPLGNKSLFSNNKKVDFIHEQNLLINENSVALFMGCGHFGIINILNKTKKYPIKACFGGFHHLIM